MVWLNKCHFWTLLQGGRGKGKMMKRMKRYIPENLTWPRCFLGLIRGMQGLAATFRLRSWLSRGNYKKEAIWVSLSNVTLFFIKRKSHYSLCLYCAAMQLHSAVCDGNKGRSVIIGSQV